MKIILLGFLFVITLIPAYAVEPVAGDAATVNAGTTDAGTTDAGTTDAGTTDAGTSDAGTSDAGTTDAGTTDAGTTDAGTTDAGTTDAGTTDAGTSDAAAAAPPIPADCDAKLATALTRLIESDTRGILGLQFKLTTLKMTKRMLGTTHRTIEATIRSDRARIDAFNAEDPTVLAGLNRLFGENAGETHNANLQARARELKAKAVDANYFRTDKRLSNQDISTYLMLDKMTNTASEINDTDIAIAWFMQNISNQVATTSGRNSAAHNLTLMSTQLARNLGQTGTNAMTEAEAEAQITSTQTAINDFLATAVTSIRGDATLASCFRDEKWKGTDTCDAAFLSNALSDHLMNLESITNLLPSVRESTVAMARASVAPRAIVQPRRTASQGTRPQVRPNPQRQLLNASMLAVHNMGSEQRLTCPDRRSVSFRSTDLNNGRGNFRMTIRVGGRLYTAKRELSPSAQMNCVSRIVARQCDQSIGVNTGSCFY